jgi:checkpoint serine/threonine-protein kinase
MVISENLIDFDVIETQKENIQSLPGGRSAKQLAQLLRSALVTTASKEPSLSQSQDLKNQIRQDFDKELLTLDEADDPLEIFDRYIRWTLDAYPSAQATPESGLLPLLERATKAFLTSSIYKNDPRYLKIWLLYIRLFADSPRETYAYLAKQGIGEGLALFYEEFAAWLEGAQRWSQAEEVYAEGLDRDARPTERLLRKFAEFQHRREAKTDQSDGPNSPVLPKIRPALATKTDPFAGTEESDPQARDRAAAAAAASSSSSRPGRPKLSVFADDGEPAPSSSSGSGQAWDNIGSLAERKKENTREAKPWAGEKLDGGKKVAGGLKMSIFRDPVSTAEISCDPNLQKSYDHRTNG